MIPENFIEHWRNSVKWRILPQIEQDLFDLWYVAKQKLIDLDRVFEFFSKYCANDDANIRGDKFLKNLALKKNHPDFQSDMSALLPIELNWNFEDTYPFVVDQVVSRFP